MKSMAVLLLCVLVATACAETEPRSPSTSFASARMGLVSEGGAEPERTPPVNQSLRCAGEYSGTYQGDDEGDVVALLSQDGVIDITFLSAGAGFELEGQGVVDADAVEVVLSSGATAAGTLDPERCEMQGEWANESLGFSGVWSLERSAPFSTGSGCAGQGDDFRGVTLFRPDFRLRELACADFALAELAQPDFTDAVLDNSSFRGADLEEPIFIGTSLQNADFRGALLTRAQFVEADLTGADLQITIAGDIAFVSTICPDGSNSSDNDDSCS